MADESIFEFSGKTKICHVKNRRNLFMESTLILGQAPSRTARMSTCRLAYRPAFDIMNEAMHPGGQARRGGSMAIRFACTCGRQFTAKDENAGRRTRCPSCDGEIQVPTIPPPFAGRTSIVAPPILPLESEVPSLMPPSSPVGKRSHWPVAAVSALCLAFGLGGWILGTTNRLGPRTKSNRANETLLPPLPPLEAKRDPDYSQWTLVRTFPWNAEELNCVSFSPDGQTIAVGGGTQKRTELSGDPDRVRTPSALGRQVGRGETELG